VSPALTASVSAELIWSRSTAMASFKNAPRAGAGAQMTHYM
jgi:hypothetical protein